MVCSTGETLLGPTVLPSYEGLFRTVLLISRRDLLVPAVLSTYEGSLPTRALLIPTWCCQASALCCGVV